MLKHAGRYEIVAELGHGGFGNVYRAFDPTLNSMVAIKTLAVENDASILARFRNEAAASRRLHHPNIVTIFDFGEQDGTPFIVMELLEGQDLRHVIDGGQQLPVWHKIQIMTQIASGLGHAHANDIVHRDVKPANVMLLPDGSVKIMDFGIARVSRDTQNRLTPRGAVLGTFNYMAPEQFRGLEQDGRGDIFAYGLMFYELLAGVHPFNAAEPAALMYNILNVEPVPIHEVCPGCPEQVHSVIARLLQKDPDLRYQTFEDVLFDCEPILTELRRERAADLFQQARSVLADRQLEAAQALLRQVMELSPSYPGARELRERVQTELRRSAVRPKVDALANEARERLASGNAEEAVQKVEAAARLDPTDTSLKVLLDQAKGALERSRKASRLVAHAERALNSGDVTGARRFAQQALELAPTETQARSVLSRSEAALAEQERQLRLAESLARVRRLIDIRSWDETTALLAQIEGEFPQLDELRDLRETLKRGRRADERQRQLAAGLAAARQEIQTRSLEAARNRLVSLQAEFPEAAEVDQLLRYATSELEALKHTEFVERSLNAVRALADRSRYADAVRLLQAALVRYPADPVLERELRSNATAQQQAERAAELRQALDTAKELHGQGRFEDALAALQTFSSRYERESARDPAIEELRQTIERDREVAERTAQLRTLSRRVNDLLAGGKAEEAAIILKEPPKALQDHPELRHLRALAQGQLDRQRERAAAFDAAVASANALLEKNEFDAAMQVLAAFSARFGADPRFAELEASIRSGRQEWERRVEQQSRLAEEQRRAEEERRAEHRRVEEQRRAEEQQRQFEEQQRRTEELNRLVRGVEGLLAEGKALEAGQLLKSCPSEFKERPEISRLRAEVLAQLRRQAEREAAVQFALASAQSFEQQSRFDDALSALGAFVQQYGPSNRIAALEQAVRNAREAARRASETQELAQRTRELLAKDDPHGALTLLQPAASLVGESPALRELQKTAETRLVERKAREAAAVIEAEARALLGRGEFGAALKAIDAGLQRFPFAAELRSVRTEIEAAQAAQQLEGIREQSIGQILSYTRQHDFARARDAWAEAQSKLPGDEQLRRLQADIEAESQRWEAAQADEKFQESVRRAQALLASQPAESLALLTKLSVQRPGQPELAALLAQAQGAVRQAEERQLIQEAEWLCGQSRFQEALAKLSRADRQTPEVQAARQRVEARRLDAENESIANAIRSARETAYRSPKKALLALEELNTEFPNRPDIARAIAETFGSIKETERQNALAEIQELIARADYSEARSAHRKAVARFGSDAALKELLERIEAGPAPKPAPIAAPPDPIQIAATRTAATQTAPTRTTPTQTEPVPSPSKPVWVWAAAGLAVAAVLGAVLWKVTQHPPPPPPAVQIHLAVRTDPTGATVQIGDRSCVTPNCQFDLAPGSYNIQAQLQGYLPKQQTLTLNSTPNPYSVSLTLDPVPAPIQSGVDSGTLVIRAGLPDVLVYVDGAGSGRTGPNGEFDGKFEAKAHTIRVQKSGYEVSPSGEQEVSIVKNSPKTVVFKLTPQMSTLELRGAPAGIEVRADNTLLGRTDGAPMFSWKLQPGDRVLKFSGGAPDIQRKFEPGETAVVEWPKPAVVNPPVPVDPAERDWVTVSTSTDPAAIEDYLKKYVNSRHKTDAESRLDDATWARVNQNDIKSLQDYLDHLKNGRHAGEASSRIPEVAWNGVDQKDEQAIRRFQQQYPNSIHASQAKSLVDQFDKARQDADLRKKLDQAKQEDEAKKQRDKQQQLEAQQRGQVLETLTRLNTALGQRNQRNFKAIWPGPTNKGYVDTMAFNVVITLEPTQPVNIAFSGDQATVLCIQIYKTSPPRPPQQVKVTLQKQGDAWIVLTIGAA